jgi:hypoxanthine phosphoribosyltransferase
MAAIRGAQIARPHNACKENDTHVIQSEQIVAPDFAPSSWLGPPLRTLQDAQFDAACAELMRLVEADYRPVLIVGIRTGGLIVAEAMARAAASPPTILPLTSRRATTATKSRLPLLRQMLSVLPTPALDLLRRVEHRFLTARRTTKTAQQEVDHGEAAIIATHVALLPPPARVLVVDDAVDSGTTLAAVLRTLQGACRPHVEIRSAVITQTLQNPSIRPDYVLFRGTLCRFPWSFDAR